LLSRELGCSSFGTNSVGERRDDAIIVVDKSATIKLVNKASGSHQMNISPIPDCAHGHWLCLVRSAPRRLEISRYVSRISFFGLSRFPKADAFPSPVIVNEINSGGFERSAKGGFICEGNGDFPVNDLGPTDSCNANL